MKIIYYRTLLARGQNITHTERIVYSFLVSKSIMQLDEVFQSDGAYIDISLVYDYLDDSNWVDMFYISMRNLSKELNITLQTAFNSVKRLKEEGYIRNDKIYVNCELLEKGYFELHKSNVLNGQVLIFYSYLKDKAKNEDDKVSINKNSLAELFGVKVYSINQYLQKIYSLGLAKRLDDGKLLIM